MATGVYPTLTAQLMQGNNGLVGADSNDNNNETLTAFLNVAPQQQLYSGSLPDLKTQLDQHQKLLEHLGNFQQQSPASNSYLHNSILATSTLPPAYSNALGGNNFVDNFSYANPAVLRQYQQQVDERYNNNVNNNNNAIMNDNNSYALINRVMLPATSSDEKSLTFVGGSNFNVINQQQQSPQHQHSNLPSSLPSYYYVEHQNSHKQHNPQQQFPILSSTPPSTIEFYQNQQPQQHQHEPPPPYPFSKSSSLPPTSPPPAITLTSIDNSLDINDVNTTLLLDSPLIDPSNYGYSPSWDKFLQSPVPLNSPVRKATHLNSASPLVAGFSQSQSTASDGTNYNKVIGVKEVKNEFEFNPNFVKVLPQQILSQQQPNYQQHYIQHQNVLQQLQPMTSVPKIKPLMTMSFALSSSDGTRATPQKPPTRLDNMNDNNNNCTTFPSLSCLGDSFDEFDQFNTDDIKLDPLDINELALLHDTNCNVTDTDIFKIHQNIHTVFEFGFRSFKSFRTLQGPEGTPSYCTWKTELCGIVLKTPMTKNQGKH
ncbi:hypothetical protein HELRODRAFT_189824 [Helobdella robusta]|uniref:Uncharacterized protein n=1 Tax=Helobdella robusta TaxID=6412 RepID=T1FRE4_HELRO|nr:hypothetical protein HELRODRAFT_189824 [Helobdella robusta]ESN90272.1 hypothetical protein HELRODRAFT_189824 [Helobdella robusta]